MKLRLFGSASKSVAALIRSAAREPPFAADTRELMRFEMLKAGCTGDDLKAKFGLKPRQVGNRSQQIAKSPTKLSSEMGDIKKKTDTLRRGIPQNAQRCTNAAARQIAQSFVEQTLGDAEDMVQWINSANLADEVYCQVFNAAIECLRNVNVRGAVARRVADEIARQYSRQ